MGNCCYLLSLPNYHTPIDPCPVPSQTQIIFPVLHLNHKDELYWNSKCESLFVVADDKNRINKVKFSINRLSNRSEIHYLLITHL